MLTPAARTDTAQAAPSLAAAGHGENKTRQSLHNTVQLSINFWHPEINRFWQSPWADLAADSLCTNDTKYHPISQPLVTSDPASPPSITVFF